MRDTGTPASTQSPEPTMPPSRPKEETARLGKEIYERDIRRRVEADHEGKVVAIDVESGRWAIDGGVLEAVDRLQAQWPDAYDIWCERVGYRALASFGGGSVGNIN